MAPTTGVQEGWSSRFVFFMACIGSAVGLGNFWRFPFTAGENGGAIFVLVYIACIILVAFPVLVAEYAIGRRGGKSAVAATRALAAEAGRPTAWAAAGWIGMVTAFLILSFYSVVAGWVILYIFKAFSGIFTGLSPEAIGQSFSNTIGDPTQVVIAHTAFMAVTAAIVARGVHRGIEIAVQILMPLFFLMLVGVVIFGVFVGDAGAAALYLFRPEPCVLFEVVGDATAANACGAASDAATQFSLSNVSAIVSSALGQAFFSIGVGVGLMITYGSYIRKSEPLLGSAAIVSTADTLVALVAGMAIFPIVFAFGVDPSGGPGLFFVTLPIAFSQLGALGAVFGGVFFTLAFFAALTSSISLFEVAVAWAKDSLGLSRPAAAGILGVACWAIGMASALSGDVLDFMDLVTGKLLLPLGGLLVAVFAGWVVGRGIFRDELNTPHEGAFRFWRFLIRWVAPIGAGAIALVSVYSLLEALGLVGG